MDGPVRSSRYLGFPTGIRTIGRSVPVEPQHGGHAVVLERAHHGRAEPEGDRLEADVLPHVTSLDGHVRSVRAPVARPRALVHRT